MAIPMRLAASSVGFLTLIVIAEFASAQSGSGARPPARQQGSSNQASGSAMKQTELAMQGYCPVALVENRQWVKGNAQFAVDVDGKRYYFVGAQPLEMFRANPIKYVPALGGDDIVEFAHTGRRSPGALENGLVYDDRIFFFGSAANKQAFQANPDQYASADLAMGGDCIVCQVNMNQKMAGDQQFTEIHQGMRFLFAGEQQRQAFLADPMRYLGAGGSGSAQRGSGMQQMLQTPGSGSGAR